MARACVPHRIVDRGVIGLAIAGCAVVCYAAAVCGQSLGTGRGVASWLARNTGTYRDGRVIYARNDSTVPILLTQVRLSDCTNVKAPCETAIPTPQVVAPSGQVEVLDVEPADPQRKPTFRFGLEWRVASQCIGIVEPVSVRDTVAEGAFPPKVSGVPTSLIQSVPRSMNGVQFTVRFFVAASGKADSIVVSGVTDPRFLAKVRAAMAEYTLIPARRGMCPVSGVATAQLTFGRP